MRDKQIFTYLRTLYSVPSNKKPGVHPLRIYIGYVETVDIGITQCIAIVKYVSRHEGGIIYCCNMFVIACRYFTYRTSDGHGQLY